MPSKILFPTDYSPASNAALRYALILTRQSGGSLLVVHVKVPTIVASPPSSADHDDEMQSELLTLLTSSSDGASPVTHEFRIVNGDPATEIARVAREEKVDLIVMATMGRTGLRRIVMGSVAAAVFQHAPCPVLNVRQSLEGAPSSEFFVPELQVENPLADVAGLGADLGSPSDKAPSTAAMSLLERAINARATDVHFDPFDGVVEVRFRIDGRLERYCRLQAEIAHGLVTQLKVLAGIDIADPFHPGEGHISLPGPLGGFEVRLTRVPVAGGESLALRLLDRQRVLRPLDGLGLSCEALERLHQILRLGEGLVLITGPAGAGKTTTAYSMIHAIDDHHRNIVTIEDPIEYRVAGFRQMAVDARHGVTMTSGLRSLLRMDPDVVLVGEIRDCEAEIAMRAASSGKYVFTTLHTRDVASTITALRDSHIDNRSLAANLAGITSQRLVRRLCPHCRQQAPLEPRHARLFSEHDLAIPAELPAAGRCPKCRETGYFERIGVFEVVMTNHEIREAIERGDPEDELRNLLRSAGSHSLLSDGLQKVHDHITTWEEVHAMTWAATSM